MYARITRTAGVVALSAALALVSGCGNEAPPAPDPGGPATAAGAAPTTTTAAGAVARSADGPVCPAAAPTGQALGMTIPKPPSETRFGKISVVCQYDGTLTANGDSTFVTVRLATGYSTRDFAQAREQSVGYQLTDQPGLGDEAFSFETKSFRSVIMNLWVRKGDVGVYIGAVATLEQEKQLLSIVLAG